MKELLEIEEELLAPGHRACPGCGEALAIRIALKALGRNVIVVQATGCGEVVSTPYPQTAWRVPYIHVAFENAAAVASGIECALKKLGKKDVKVVAFAGDGGTADIGLQALSGAVERGHDFIYICTDNEAYMNTGIQRSGTTPFLAWTTTTPAGKVGRGKRQWKKDVPAIIAAHRAPYVATASVGYPLDLYQKIKKAKYIKGPCYIHIQCPCPPGWRFDSSKTIQVARKAVESGCWVLYEIEHGQMRVTFKPSKRIPVSEYLKLQGRFRHLTQEEIQKFQELVDQEWKRLGLE